jgi:hypothetical protein
VAVLSVACSNRLEDTIVLLNVYRLIHNGRTDADAIPKRLSVRKVAIIFF